MLQDNYNFFITLPFFLLQRIGNAATYLDWEGYTTSLVELFLLIIKYVDFVCVLRVKLNFVLIVQEPLVTCLIQNMEIRTAQYKVKVYAIENLS